MADKKVHFVSLGCPKNLVDTEIMLGSLSQNNYQVVGKPEEADTVIVNTCGFIEAAKKESIDHILQLSELKERGHLKDLVVAGCLTQRYKDELVEGLPEADLFIGSGEFQNIAEILRLRNSGSQQKSYYGRPTYLQEATSPRLNSQPRHRAYLKISEGCKKRCAFCAIPMIRGNLQSRTLTNLLSEAKLLVAGGVKELTVISHDFTDYGWDLRRQNESVKESPVGLLRDLADNSGAKWIRVLYLYPDGVNDELVDLVRSRDNLLNYFDMPFQHVNDDVLKKMNRRMTRKEIETAIGLIRKSIPDATIRTQFIVGFPGETEQQFNELLDFVKTHKLDRVGCFKYSPEEGTKGATLPDPVSEEIKEERYQQLMALQKDISRDKQNAMVGKVLPVIVEGYSDETELLLEARHAGQAVEIDGLTYINEGQAQIGDIVSVEITQSHDYDLVGRVVEPSV